MSLEAVASKLDKSKGHLHAVENGITRRRELALDIEQLTDGEVDAAFLNPEIAKPGERSPNGAGGQSNNAVD
jgi:hypothetical protein